MKIDESDSTQTTMLEFVPVAPVEFTRNLTRHIGYIKETDPIRDQHRINNMMAILEEQHEQHKEKAIVGQLSKNWKGYNVVTPNVIEDTFYISKRSAIRCAKSIAKAKNAMKEYADSVYNWLQQRRIIKRAEYYEFILESPTEEVRDGIRRISKSHR